VAPSLVSPGDDETLASRTITFRWNALSGCTFNGYTFRLCTTADVNSPGVCFIDASEGGTQRAETITGRDDQDLWWGVKAANAPQGADWAVGRFRIHVEFTNSGFEAGSGDTPDIWRSQTIQGDGSFTWDSGVAHTGSRSVKISASQQSIARWWQVIAVDPDSEYELAGWIKTSNVQDPSAQGWVNGARLGVYGMDSYLAASTDGLNGTHDWTHVTTRFVTGKTTQARVTCTLGEADPLSARPTSSGTMWCDDLTLTKVRTLSRTSLQGRHVALDMYTEDYAHFNDPVAYVALLDEVYDAMAELVNGAPFSGDRITIRSDASMYYGLLSGNPILIGPGHSWPDVVNEHGIDFGVPHEIGHAFDLSPQSELYMGQMTFDNAEHWANLKLLYAYDVVGANHPQLTAEIWSQTAPISQVGQRYVEVHAQPWIDAGRTDYQNMHNDTYTGLLYILRQRAGWGPFRATFQEFSRSAGVAPSTDLAKVELWANTLSRHAGMDFIPAFQSWGFPIHAYAKTYLPLLAR
jgi:hypothetical protein